MYGLFENIKGKVRQFMVGRYGLDALSRALLLTGLLLAVISVLRPLRFCYLLALLALLIAELRSFSRNGAKRYAENQRYLRYKSRALGTLRLWRQAFRDRKLYRYYVCPICRQHLRVPRGKGKIRINCPKCKNSFIRKT